MVSIFCKNSGERLEFKDGITLQEALPSFNFKHDMPILVAKVNNVVEGLKFRVYNNLDVEYFDYESYVGRSAYSRSLCFLMSKATGDVCPGCQVKIRRPISKGYYCQVNKADGTPLTADEISAIKKEMRQLVLAKAEFHRHVVPLDEAIALFKSMGCEDKVKILSTSGSVYVRYYTLEGTPDMYYDAMLPTVEHLKVWSLEPFKNGMFLRIPDRHKPGELAPFVEQPKTFSVLKESIHWNEIMGLETVGDLNIACANGHATELIQVSEALQEKKIVQIAEEVFARFHSEKPIRLILITGPTSSGKTTMCKRLSIQLKACGLKTVSFSTDDYFVNRVETPKLPDGNYDFDNFDTVDHDALQKDLKRLLEGEKIEVPEYNFVTGIREYNGKTLELTPSTVVILEGIHALNPALTDSIPQESIYRIFINTITSISVDYHNSISTSDNRLLRRIVRDYNMGAYSACETISNWPNVRRAEVKWIYPYQELADTMINSAYLIEFAVLRSHAERILMTVPKNCPQYSEANRLMKFLQYFCYVSDEDVPSTSLLRSFIGGSKL